MIKVISFILFILAATSVGHAQFNTTGNANATANCNEFIITPNSTNQTGSLYSTTPINLNTSFSLLFEVNFGCDGFGGEGMAFVLQPGAWTTGTGGFGLGYQGLTNTIAVEFDTRDNQGSGQTTNWDIAGDHISIMSGGIINHSAAGCLTGLPLDPISTFTGEVEDCQDHMVEIIWTAGAVQTLEVKVDGATSIIHTSDMITNDLGGATTATWGWTGSTSIFSNEQKVGIALAPDFTYSATNCPGQNISFSDNSQAQNNIVQYDWDFDGTLLNNGGPNPNHTFVTAGNHPVTLTVTDDQGCTSSSTIDIGVGFEVNITSDDGIICPGTSTILHAEGTPYVGNTCCFELHCYDAWSDGWGGTEIEIFVDGTSAGTVFPPDLGGGSAHTETFNFCWDVGSVIDLQVNGTTGIQPQESSVYLINSSGDTVADILSDFLSGSTSWYDGATTQYIVDCGITPPTYTYQWDNTPLLSSDTDSDPTATLSAYTTFNVDITDPNTACVISGTISIDVYDTPTATISGNETVCQGDDANLVLNFTGPTPYDVVVNGPSGNFNENGINSSSYNLMVNEDGAYSLVAVTGNGCVGTVSGAASVTVITPPVVDIESNAVYCEGDVIADLNVVSTNGGNVEWFANASLAPVIATGNTFNPGTLTAGTYEFYAAEKELVLSCQGPSDMVTIIVNPVPPAPNVTGNTVYCEGDFPIPNQATGTLGGTITWYDDAALTNVVSTLNEYSPTLTVGTFSIYVTETANGCESAATEVIYTVKPRPGAPGVTGTTQYCEGDTPTALTATPTIGGSISWENTFNINLASGTSYTPPATVGDVTYWVYEELSGCRSDSTPVTITFAPAPDVSVPPSLAICFGDSVEVNASNNGYPITWSTGQSGETIYLNLDTTTWVTVTATNPSCGFAQDSLLLVVNPLPPVVAGNDTLIGIGGEVTLFASSPGNVAYSWVPEVQECVEDDCSIVYDVPDQATVYVVFATDANNCMNTDSVLVDINGYMDVFIPNIFSPNGDGYNDFLEVLGPRLFNYKIEIFDRWGKRVFVSDEQKNYWDGTLNGSTLEPQTFVYMLSGETVLGERIVREGNVSIIK